MDNQKLLSDLSRIARVAVPETEKQNLANKISNIIEWSSHIMKIDTGDTEPLFSVTELLATCSPQLRADEVSTPDNSEQLIELAPCSEGTFIAMPKVIEA